MQNTLHFKDFLEHKYILCWFLHYFVFRLFDIDIPVDLNISALNFLPSNSCYLSKAT